MWTGLRLCSIGTSDIAHETATYHNQPKHSFTGERKKLDRSLIDLYISMSCFYDNIRRSNFLVGTAF